MEKGFHVVKTEREIVMEKIENYKDTGLFENAQYELYVYDNLVILKDIETGEKDTIELNTYDNKCMIVNIVEDLFN